MQIVPTFNLTTLKESAARATDLVFISTAFIKSAPFEELCRVTSENCSKSIVVRWQFRDLIGGSSDLEAYETASREGWKFYFHQDLHAKIYRIDGEAYIGSANLTNRGLSGSPPAGNIELSVKVPVTDELASWCDYLEQRSTLIDDPLFEAIKNDVQDYLTTTSLLPPTRRGFNETVMEMLRERNPGPRLFLYDLPQSASPSALYNNSANLEDPLVLHDIQVFGLPSNPSVDNVRVAFRLSPGFTWLASKVRNSIGFGELSSELHDNLCDEPKPYRSEVKNRLANLMHWAADLFPGEFAISRPRYREVISRINR